MEMPGRNFNSTDYKYGYNGKENDKEISVGAQDFDAREYDNRLGRFFSMDPHKGAYPWWAPFYKVQTLKFVKILLISLRQRKAKTQYDLPRT
jgi:RHS repeat-associated protein